MGITTSAHKGRCEAIPFYKRAIELDPNFAMAYASLGVAYGNLGQASLAAENIKKGIRTARSGQRAGEISHLCFVLSERHRGIGASQPSLRTVGQELSAGLGAARQPGSDLQHAWTVREGACPKPRRVSVWSRPVLDTTATSQALTSHLNRLDDAKKPIEQAQATQAGWRYSCVSAIYHLAFLRGDARGDGAAGSLGRGQARETKTCCSRFNLIPRPITGGSVESAGLLPACGGCGSPCRLEGDGGVMAGECGAAGGGVRQRGSSKAGCRGSFGAGSRAGT